MSHQGQLAWACFPGDALSMPEDGKLPKMKLTGNGKMPVMDMRSYQEPQGLHPPVTGLPPKSPVYAVVNKVKKKPITPMSGKPFPNYMNVGPVMEQPPTHTGPACAPATPYYENAREVLARMRDMENPDHSFPNYVKMEPVVGSTMTRSNGSGGHHKPETQKDGPLPGGPIIGTFH